MTNFVSMHSFQGELVDCRRMQLEFQFSNATKQNARELALHAISEIEKLLCDAFFLNWSWNGRSIKKQKLINNIQSFHKWISLDFRGNVLTSKLNNLRAIELYNQKLFHELSVAGFQSSVSVDYWDIYTSLFNGISDPEQIRENLIELFKMEGRYLKQYWFGEDVTGTFQAIPYNNRTDSYYGYLEFRIALPCLQGNAEVFSSKLVEILKNVTQIVPDTSGRVALTPFSPPSISSNYMSYFGGGCRHSLLGRESHMHEKEWAHKCFLQGVDWCNLLTPQQTQSISQRKVPDEIDIKNLKSGGSIATINKSILQTQVSDLTIMKMYLYPVLYPGGTYIYIKPIKKAEQEFHIMAIRYRWEDVPIFENEIIALPDRILIEYQSNDMVGRQEDRLTVKNQETN